MISSRSEEKVKVWSEGCEENNALVEMTSIKRPWVADADAFVMTLTM